MSIRHQVMSLNGNKKLTIALDANNFHDRQSELKGVMSCANLMEYVTTVARRVKGEDKVDGNGDVVAADEVPNLEPECPEEGKPNIRWAYQLMVECTTLPIRRLIKTVPIGDARALFQKLKAH